MFFQVGKILKEIFESIDLDYCEVNVCEWEESFVDRAHKKS